MYGTKGADVRMTALPCQAGEGQNPKKRTASMRLDTVIGRETGFGAATTLCETTLLFVGALTSVAGTVLT